jgi:hypothetical protein
MMSIKQATFVARLAGTSMLLSAAACGGGGGSAPTAEGGSGPAATSGISAAVVTAATPATPAQSVTAVIGGVVDSVAGAVTAVVAAVSPTPSTPEPTRGATSTEANATQGTATVSTAPVTQGGASVATLPAAPTGTITSDGTGQLDMLVTRSGHWRLFGLPAQGDAAVYRMTLDENPGFVREFACRRLFTVERGDAAALQLATVTLLGQQAAVAQGSCRVVQNMDPVAPNAGWIREAVVSKALPAYRRERIWGAPLALLARDAKRGAYDPMSLGPIPGSTSTPWHSSNFVGVTSPEGGEHGASRGFLHNADARVVDAALHSEDARIVDFWPEFTQYTLYSLAQPQGAAWSAANHVTVDPQFPQTGDRGYQNARSANSNPRFDSASAVTRWERDVSHLENTGFVHWLATEDPIAGLLVQRQAAYALAGRWNYLRGGYSGTTAPADTRYEGQDEQERAVFNTLSALWKSRDVSRRVASVNGRMFWSQARAEQQAAEVIAYYDRTAARIEAAATPGSSDYAAKLSGALFGAIIGSGDFTLMDGSVVTLHRTSNFQAGQYGKEPLWLWTRAGNATVARWLTTYARHVALRLGTIGGAKGVNGLTTGRTVYPIGPVAAAGTVVTFTTPGGWAEWVAATDFKTNDPRTSFDGATAHTAIQMEGLLLLARDAAVPVPEIEPALAKVATMKAANPRLVYSDLRMHKQLSAPE